MYALTSLSANQDFEFSYQIINRVVLFFIGNGAVTVIFIIEHVIIFQLRFMNHLKITTYAPSGPVYKSFHIGQETNFIIFDQ